MNVSEMNGEKCIEFSSRCFQCNAICWTFSSVLGLERDRNQTAQDVQSPLVKKSWCEWLSFSFIQSDAVCDLHMFISDVVFFGMTVF